MGLEAFGVLLSEFFSINQTHKQKNKQNTKLRRTIVKEHALTAHTYIYTCIHVFTRVYTCPHIYTRVYTYSHVYTRVCHVYICREFNVVQAASTDLCEQSCMSRCLEERFGRHESFSPVFGKGGPARSTCRAEPRHDPHHSWNHLQKLLPTPSCTSDNLNT